MAHAVESMFSVKQTPWHSLGAVVENAPSIAEAIKLAGLDWKVEMYTPFVNLIVNNEIVPTSLDDYNQVFVRSDNRKILGTVGPNTYPLQNSDAFNWFQPFLDNKEAELTTAGSLHEGRKVWVLAKLKGDNGVIAHGDEVAKFLLISNSHDGTTAIRVGFTPIRVVCANTLAAAHGKKSGSKLLRINHSKDALKALEDVREVMNVANQTFEATVEQYRALARHQINEADLKEYVKAVFNYDELEKDGKKLGTRQENLLKTVLEYHEERTAMAAELLLRMREREEAQASENKLILEKVLENMEAGRGSEIKSTRGTGWSAYNAVNEYLNHEKGRSESTRLDSLWFGANAQLNAKALDMATAMFAS